MGKLQASLIKYSFFNHSNKCHSSTFISEKSTPKVLSKEPKESVFDVTLEHFHQWISVINTNRSKFIYSRGLAWHAILFIQKSTLATMIHEINDILGNQYSFAESIQFLNNSRVAIVNLGIVLHGIRFTIDMILMTKHLISFKDRGSLRVNKAMRQEVEKRGVSMCSDFVCIMGSLLTTYNNFFHINTFIVSPIIVGFLIFDSLFLFAKWIWESHKHYKELNELMAQQKEATELDKRAIQRQIDQLTDDWNLQNSYFSLNIFAANIIIFSFALSMICTGPFALAGFAFFSTVGNALYNTSEDYKKYRKSTIAVQRELKNGTVENDENHRGLLKILYKEQNQNYVQFWKSLEFNTVGISLLITAAAASWPIALGLTLIYALYHCYDVSQKQVQEKNTKIDYDIYRILNSNQIETPSSAPSAIGARSSFNVF